jgi:hypothetical protein
MLTFGWPNIIFSLLYYFERIECEYEITLLSLYVCVCLCIPLIVARQRFGKSHLIIARQRLGTNVTAVTNTQATIEELLVSSFSMWPVSYQGK